MERKEAKALGLTHYNTDRPCKHGHVSPRRVKDRKCTECEVIAKKLYIATNKEHVRALKKASYERTKEHHLAQKKIYRQANKGKINALVSLRKKRIKERTPCWVDKEHLWLIKEVYELAALRTAMTKISWHVDHIIPLNGKTVTGLHVIDNLQVIPGVENIRKKNRYAE